MSAAILTNLAITLMRDAAGGPEAVAISHVALGDANGQNYAPAAGQTGLVNERIRLPIERRQKLGPASWRVLAKADAATTPAFAMREIGFFTADNQLIAIWAGLDVVPRQLGIIDYLINHVLSFATSDADVIFVDAPNDDLFDFAVQTATALARHELAIRTHQESAA